MKKIRKKENIIEGVKEIERDREKEKRESVNKRKKFTFINIIKRNLIWNKNPHQLLKKYHLC